MPRLRRSLVLLLGLALLAPLRSAQAFPDPLEPLNRAFYWLNSRMRGLGGAGDGSPVRDNYELAVPEGMRNGLSNIFANLREPVTAISSLLAGDLDNAGVATERFVLNSTLGIGGALDVARTRYGLESRLMELGQVVCAYGLPEGPFLVLPLFGPTTIPEMAGRVLTIVGGFQLFGRPYFRYRLTDRLHRVAEGRAGYAQPVVPAPGATDQDLYQAEKAAYEAYRRKSCAEVPPSGNRAIAVFAGLFAPFSSTLSSLSSPFLFSPTP